MQTLTASTFVICLLAATAPASHAAPPAYATAYQVNASHNGNIAFSTPFAAPLKQAWSVNFAGGVSYPIVAEGKVFVTVDNSASGTPLIVALDLATGAIVWEKAAATGSLAYDGGRLFFTTFSGPLQAFDAKTGRQVWSVQLPGQYEFNMLPIAAHGFVYTGGVGGGTTVYQVNEATGKLGWTQSLAAGGQGATIGAGEVFYAVPCDVPAFKTTNGKLLWNFNSGCDGGGGNVAAFWRNRVFAPGVNITGGIVLNATTGATIGALNGALPAFWQDISYTATQAGITASNIITGNLAWEFGSTDPLSSLPIVVNSTVFVASATGKIYALDAASGKLLQTLTPGTGTAPPSYSLVTGLGAGQGYLVAPTGSVLSAYTP